MSNSSKFYSFYYYSHNDAKIRTSDVSFALFARAMRWIWATHWMRTEKKNESSL
jgi:hypothetical protein